MIETARVSTCGGSTVPRVILASEPAPGHAENEDNAFQYGPLVGVFDGVTAPPGIDTGCVHGPAWYVRRLTARLVETATARPAASLADTLADAIRRVRDDHDGRCDLTNPTTPAATVCLVRDAGGYLDYLLLADCTLVVEHGDRVDAITDHRFEVAVAELRQVTLAPGARIGSPERAARLRQIVGSKSALTNQPGGYWVAAANPDAARHAVTGTLPLTGPDRVRRVALLTDGASCAVEQYRLTDWAGLLDLLTDQGPDELIGRIRQAEDADPDGLTYPRHKRHDDATVAFCVFDPPDQAG